MSSSSSNQAPPLTSNSTPALPDSLWYCKDFILGAGCVIIQPSTGRIVLLYDDQHKFWFLPKGRKDIGESLEQAALREAHEESGYRVQFLPLAIPTCAPSGSQNHSQGIPKPTFNTEPIFVSTQYHVTGRRNLKGIEYLTFWYVAHIGPDAVPEEGTRMPDEQGYHTHLLHYDEVMKRLGRTQQAAVVMKAYELWQQTERMKTSSSEVEISHH